MVEKLQINKSANKSEIYQEILPQIGSVIASENNLVANLANIAAILTEAFGHWWTGFYLRDGHSLVLGPFQGPLACTRIPVDPVPRGVCGAAAATCLTQVVPDVDKFPGHIACSAASRSEIVVPLVVNGRTELVLDIDSAYLNSFDEIDKIWLEKILSIIAEKHYLSLAPRM